MHRLEREYSGRITFVRANIHSKATFALQEKYGFTATPEFFLVDGGGNIQSHWDGDVTAADLEQTFNRILVTQSSK